MKKACLLILLFFGNLHSSEAYTEEYRIYGKVLDNNSNDPIGEATVFIQSLNIRSTTDSNGYYSLNVPSGTYTVEAFNQGMVVGEQTVDVINDVKVDFFLKELSINLEEVEITETRTETMGISRLRAVDGFGIYEAKKNELIILDDFAANKISNNARQVFAKVPGLNIWESDCAGLQLDIAARGLGPSRTANFNTRQNGYDMSADALGYPESYYIPSLLAVDKIEIVRGAASLQYGTQFGGMLNFKMKEAPENTPFELNLEQGVGSFGLSNSFISIGGTANKLDYYAYYQYKTGDCWRDNSGFYSHTAFGKIGYQANEALKVSFEYSFLDYETQQPGGLTDEVFESGNIEQSTRDRNWFKVNWNLMAAIVDYKFSNRTKLNVRTFGLISSRDALGDLILAGQPVDPSSNRTLIRDEFANIGSEARLVHRYAIQGKNSVLLVGSRYYNGLTNRRQGLAKTKTNEADFSFLNPDSPENFDYDYPGKNYALFAENLIDVTNKLSITPGFRYEYIQTDSEGSWNQIVTNFAKDTIAIIPNEESRTETRSFPLFGLGASYYLQPDVNLYANVSQNFRSITFSDLRVENPNFLLDSLITDEKGYNVDLGIRGVLLPWLNLDLSFFLLQYNERIGETFTTTTTKLFRTNIGDSRHYGLEAFAEVDILKLLNQDSDHKLSLFTNLSLIHATYIRSDDKSILGNDVEYVPGVMFRTGLNYAWNSLKLSYQFSYLSDQFSDATNSASDPSAVAGIIPSYQVMDFSAEYSWRKLKATTGINNLTNQKYFTRRAVSYPGPGIIPATIRSFYFSLGIKI